MMKKIGFILGLLFLLASCSQDRLLPSSDSLSESVVHVSLHTSPMKVTTRSTALPALPADVASLENDIRQLWAFQFESSADGSGQLLKKINLVVYDPLDIDLLLQANATGKKSKLYFVANMGYAVFPNAGAMTESQFKVKVSEAVTTEGGFLLRSSQTDRRIPMYGECTDLITVGAGGMLTQAITANLVRMLARVDVVYNVASSFTGFSLQGIHVCNIPKYMQYYRANNAEFVPVYGTTETAPTITNSSNDLFNTDFETAVNTQVATTTLTYYLPENHRGVGGNLASEKDERFKLGVDNATYFEFAGSSPSNDLLTYRFYPGKDNYNDYNIDRNTFYTLNVTLTGGTLNDPRITTLAKSNCYIVAPGGSVSIPIIRANEGTPVKPITSLTDSKCNASILWQTDPNINYVKLSNEVGCKGGFFTVSVPGTSAEGNAVICLKNQAGTIVWSWHIWVTSYAPATTPQLVNGTPFMDRNLGASTNDITKAGSYGLLYQWGRKDPFLGGYILNNNSIPATYTGVSNGASYGFPGSPSPPTGAAALGVTYAINYPTTFVIGVSTNNYDWVSSTASTKDDTLWGGVKTAYDPCPVGWRVPTHTGSVSPWLGFDTKSTGTVAANKWNDYSLFPWNNQTTFYGRATAGNVLYPAAGFRTFNNNTLSAVGVYGAYWTGTPNATSSYYMYFDNANVSITGPNNNTGNYRGNACSIRCVQE